jgi:uncharacterized protein YjbI with pentapeptide repeats
LFAGRALDLTRVEKLLSGADFTEANLRRSTLGRA